MLRRTRTPGWNTRVPRHQESDSDIWDRSQVGEVTLFVREAANHRPYVTVIHLAENRLLGQFTALLTGREV